MGFDVLFTYANVSFEGWLSITVDTFVTLEEKNFGGEKRFDDTIAVMSFYYHSCLRHLVLFTHDALYAVQISYKLLSNGVDTNIFFDGFGSYSFCLPG